MNADGSGLTDLTGMRTGCEGQPAFTPDGQRIVFMRFDDAADIESIQSMDLTGGDRRLVTGTKGSGRTDPNVSPDGNWITFIRTKKDDELQASLRGPPRRLRVAPGDTVQMGCRHQARLVTEREADRAHDKRRLGRPHKSANLVTIRPDGSGLKRLTRFAGGEHAKECLRGFLLA